MQISLNYLVAGTCSEELLNDFQGLIPLETRTASMCSSSRFTVSINQTVVNRAEVPELQFPDEATHGSISYFVCFKSRNRKYARHFRGLGKKPIATDIGFDCERNISSKY